MELAYGASGGASISGLPESFPSPPYSLRILVALAALSNHSFALSATACALFFLLPTPSAPRTADHTRSTFVTPSHLLLGRPPAHPYSTCFGGHPNFASFAQCCLPRYGESDETAESLLRARCLRPTLRRRKIGSALALFRQHRSPPLCSVSRSYHGCTPARHDCYSTGPPRPRSARRRQLARLASARCSARRVVNDRPQTVHPVLKIESLGRDVGRTGRC